jgi:hypothetical protein
MSCKYTGISHLLSFFSQTSSIALVTFVLKTQKKNKRLPVAEK